MCSSKTIVKTRAAHIERGAQCNGLSIHMGPATIRIDQSMLTERLLSLGEARRFLQKDGTLCTQPAASA